MFRAVPVRRRGVRARPGPQARRVPDQRLDHRPGLLRVRGLHRPPAGQARPRRSRPGCRSPPAATWSARTASCRPRAAARSSRPLDELVAEVARPGRRRRARGHAAGPERQLLRAVAAAAARRSPSCSTRSTASRASTASATRARTPRTCSEDVDPRPRRAAERVRAHPPAAAVGLRPRCSKRMRRTYIARALPRPRGADPRARPGLRDHHRHHRRLPGRDRGGLRGDARGRRGGRLRRRLHVHLLAAPRHRGGRASPTSSCRTSSSVERMERLVEVDPAAGARARAALRRPHARGARRGHLAPRRRRACAAARATTRS